MNYAFLILIWMSLVYSHESNWILVSISSRVRNQSLTNTCVMSRHRQLHLYSNLDWEPTQSREPALQPTRPKGQTRWREASRPAGLSHSSLPQWHKTPLSGNPPFSPGQRETWQSVGSEWTINALSFTQACGRAPNVMSRHRQLDLYSNLDWEPTQSREPAL